MAEKDSLGPFLHSPKIVKVIRSEPEIQKVILQSQLEKLTQAVFPKFYVVIYSLSQIIIFCSRSIHEGCHYLSS